MARDLEDEEAHDRISKIEEERHTTVKSRNVVSNSAGPTGPAMGSGGGNSDFPPKNRKKNSKACLTVNIDLNTEKSQEGPNKYA